MANSWKDAVEQAVQGKKLSPESAENIRRLVASSQAVPMVEVSIGELVSAGEWAELNDRFFRTLAFGTGGLRGRTIGKVVTKAEQGKPTALGRPEFPAVGTNCMNYGNVARATQGLVNYLKRNFSGQAPSVVFSHDTRHFSREFAELSARTVAAAGGTAYLSPRTGPRPSSPLPSGTSGRRQGWRSPPAITRRTTMATRSTFLTGHRLWSRTPPELSGRWRP